MTTISINTNQKKSFWESNFGYVLRWIGFIPAAAIISIVIVSIVTVVFLLGDLFDGTIWLYLKNPGILSADYFLIPFVNAAIIGFSFVSFGSAIAPKRKVASLVLSILLAIIFGISAFGNCIFHEWKMAAQNITTIIFGAATCYYIFNNEA